MKLIVTPSTTLYKLSSRGGQNLLWNCVLDFFRDEIVSVERITYYIFSLEHHSKILLPPLHANTPLCKKIWWYQTVIIRRKLKKNRQCSGQAKKIGQTMIYKTRNINWRLSNTNTPTKNDGELRCSKIHDSSKSCVKVDDFI